MQQLTTSDAMFLYMEHPSSYGHVCGLKIFDAPRLPQVRSGQAYDDHMEAFLQMVPFSRRRLVEMPIKLGHPYWVDDPDFDLEYHWRQTAIPSPGTREQVEQVVSRIAARPLDRARPMWELYEIEGLDDGEHFAIFTKIHHSAADGAAMMALALATLTMTPEIVTHPRPETVFEPDRIPSQLELMARGALQTVGRPGKTISFARRTLRELASNLGAEDGLRAQLPDVFAQVRSFRAPSTRFNGMVGPHRRFAYGSTSLEDVKAIKTAFGVSVNDVVLALCAGMLRQWFLDRNELPEQSLVAMVPVNIREGDAIAGGNAISAASGKLFTDIADPVERLGRISEHMKGQKAIQNAVPASVQLEGLNVLAPWAMYQAIRLAYRTRQTPRFSPFNLTISNVPGPPFPVYLDGAPQLGSYPYSAITDGLGLNITVTSYNGNLDWGIVSDRDMVDDLWPMLEGLEKASAELLSLAR
jgi:WS/DGAT/MGAT family acyltransferase